MVADTLIQNLHCPSGKYQQVSTKKQRSARYLCHQDQFFAKAWSYDFRWDQLSKIESVQSYTVASQGVCWGLQGKREGPVSSFQVDWMFSRSRHAAQSCLSFAQCVSCDHFHRLCFQFQSTKDWSPRWLRLECMLRPLKWPSSAFWETLEVFSPLDSAWNHWSCERSCLHSNLRRKLRNWYSSRRLFQLCCPLIQILAQCLVI